MNPTFLARLQALQQQKHSTNNNAPKGMTLTNVPIRNTTMDFAKVLVIPPGLGSKVKQFSDFGAVIAKGVDTNYPTESVKEFVATVNLINPSVIVAGSRGTELVREMFKKTTVKCVILFGPVHLREFFKVVDDRTKVLVVHGVDDVNEKIQTVRSLVQDYKKAKLVEIHRQGHSLNISDSSLRKLVHYGV
jgi:UDP-glucose 6-dehydrogenase